MTAYGQIVLPESDPRNIGAGWVAQLGTSLRMHADVVARGFPGYDSRCALAALPAALGGLGNSKLTIFIIWFGTNDAKHVGKNIVARQDFKK